MSHPTPHAADLKAGDRIHPDQPPTCCGQPMGYYGTGDLSLWECATCQRGLGTDADGVIDYIEETP